MWIWISQGTKYILALLQSTGFDFGTQVWIRFFFNVYLELYVPMCSLPDGHLYLLAVSLAFDAWELWWHIIGWKTYLASARLVGGGRGTAVTANRLPCRQEGGLVGPAACNTQCIFRVNMALAKANMPFLDTTSLCVYKEAPADGGP